MSQSSNWRVALTTFIARNDSERRSGSQRQGCASGNAGQGVSASLSLPFTFPPPATVLPDFDAECVSYNTHCAPRSPHPSSLIRISLTVSASYTLASLLQSISATGTGGHHADGNHIYGSCWRSDLLAGCGTAGGRTDFWG